MKTIHRGLRPVRSVAWAVACLLLTARLSAVIVITEIMYHPKGGGRDLEYIELHNETPDPVDITNYYFAEGVSFTFTERTILKPGAYIVVCANAERVKTEYGIQNAVGDWDPDTALSNGGERISLANPGGAIEASVRYNDRGKWPSGADGTGHSLELEDPYRDIDDPDHWELSGVLGGSPGKQNDTETGRLPILVNEAYLLPGEGARWVELYNKSDAEVDLSGFLITADRDPIVHGTIPAGTKIPPRGWVSFTDTALGLDFSPRPTADEPPLNRTFIAIWNPEGTRVIDARVFQPREGFSEARIPDGNGYFSEAADPTRDAANEVTVVTDVVINELMYHPWDNDTHAEYVELYNRGAEAVELDGWSFTDGIQFEIPPGTILPSEAYLVVARDPERIRETYGLPAAQVLGPTSDEEREAFGVLADRGERVTLSDTNGNIVDTVRYHDGGEWPRWADGGCSSMELIDPFQDNSVAQAWDSSDESSKSQAREYSYTGQFIGGEPEFHLVLPAAGIVVVDDLKMVSQTTSVEARTTFIDSGDTWRIFRGTVEPPADWTAVAFDDTAWESGAAPIGFGETDTVTILDDMRNNYAAFYVRKDFSVEDPSQVEGLIFQIEYDDGYIAYLNGTEIALGNMDPEKRSAADTALVQKEKVKEAIDLADRRDLLLPGKNVLAVQVHNTTLTSADTRFIGSLVDGKFVTTDGPTLFKDGEFETDSYRSYWTIQGTHYRSGRTTVDPLSGAGSLKIISTGGGDNKVNRIETSNAGFTTPATRTDYHVTFLARWIAGCPTLLTHGAYSGAASPSYAMSTRLDLPAHLGTPGGPNSVTLALIAATGSSDMGPVVRDVSQDPTLPAAAVPVRVRARVSDPDGVSEVTLHYSLNTPVAPESASLKHLPMAGPDAEGYYSVEVPGQTLKTRVVFYITATDAKGTEGRFPLDYAHRTNPLLLDAASASVNDHLYLIYRHDTPINVRQHSYRFWMHQANEAYLGSRPLLSNDLVDGSFLFQNRDLYYNSKIRFSGSPWARQAWAESYRVRMPKDNPLHGRIESFNLEDHQDGGARSAKERISHYLIRWHNGPTRMPYSLQWIVHLQVNDRVSAGEPYREHTQTPNREFISRWYPDEDDGDFFEVDDRFMINDAGQREGNADAHVLYPPYGSTLNGENKEEYRYYFNLRLKEERDDFSNLIQLAKVMSPSMTPDAEFDEQVWDAWDVEELCRIWSIRLNTDDWDTWGASRGKNCYFYRPNLDGRWVNVAWDMELTYSTLGAFAPPAVSATADTRYNFGIFPEAVRMLNRPPIKRIYYGVMAEMIDRQFNSAFLAPWVAELDAIGLLNTQVAKPNGFIDQKRNLLRSAVRGVTSAVVKFAVTTNGGEPITIDAASLPAVVTIEGTAPVEISRIYPIVDAVMPEPPWEVRFAEKGLASWSATGSLGAGHHRVEFLGMSSFDEILGSVAVEITVNGDLPPVVDSVVPTRVVSGETLTVRGANFVAGSQVFFGEVESAAVVILDSAELLATVPEGLALGAVDLRVRNPSAKESGPFPIEVVASKPLFVRGDADMNGAVNITDPIVTLDYLFRGAAEPVCMDAADADDTGILNLTDAVYTLNMLFQGGPEVPPPYPDPGADPTDGDDLGCAEPLAP